MSQYTSPFSLRINSFLVSPDSEVNRRHCNGSYMYNTHYEAGVVICSWQFKY